MMVIGVQLHRADSLIIYIQHTETAVDTWRLVLFLRVCFCVFECVFRFQVCIHICLGFNKSPADVDYVSSWVSCRSPRSKDSDLHWLHRGIAVCFCFRIVVVFKLMFGVLGTGCMEWFVCSWFWFGTLCI